MKKQLLGIILLIICGIDTDLAYAQTQSYPTDEELQQLMPDFQRQVDYWNQYEEPERQREARAFAENWSRRDPAVVPFLGSWSGWEETTDIYPSTTEGQVCIIYTSEPEASFSLGKVFNQQIYTDRGEVIFQQGNYVGVAWNNENEAGITAYRLFAPAEVLTLESLSYWDEGDRIIKEFNAAGCIANEIDNAQELRRCVTWEEVKSEVQSLYDNHPLPELPDGFKNGCVFGDNGAYVIAIYVFQDGLHLPMTQDNDTLFGTSIPKLSSIDPEYPIDENWQSLRLYNVCGSVGRASTSFCQNMPTDEVFIKDGLVCHDYLCINVDSIHHTELVRLWNEALNQSER